MALEKLYNLFLISVPYCGNWYRNSYAQPEFGVPMFNYPEFIYFYNTWLKEHSLQYSSYFAVSLQTFVSSENFTFFVLVQVQLILVFISLSTFLIFFFSYWGNSNTEESTIDQEYLSISVATEAEEELGSLDDVVMGLIVFIYIFLWYFYAHC